MKQQMEPLKWIIEMKKHNKFGMKFKIMQQNQISLPT